MRLFFQTILSQNAHDQSINRVYALLDWEKRLANSLEVIQVGDIHEWFVKVVDLQNDDHQEQDRCHQTLKQRRTMERLQADVFQTA